MFNRNTKNVTDSKQKTLNNFLSLSSCKENKNMKKNAYQKSSGIVYLESSSDSDSESREQCSSESFVPSPRNYKFSSIKEIIKEDKNYQNAVDKIKKNLGSPKNPFIKEIIENTTFLDDSISPMKTRQADSSESSLLTKYLGKSKQDPSGECLLYFISEECIYSTIYL